MSTWLMFSFSLSLSSPPTPPFLPLLLSVSFFFLSMSLSLTLSLFYIWLQNFIEVEPRTQRFMLPLFGNLSRAMSTSAVSSNPHPHVRHHSHANTVQHFHSFSNPTSMTDLTISPPRSPNGGPLLTQMPVRPLFMPDANRRQRRASLVSK